MSLIRRNSSRHNAILCATVVATVLLALAPVALQAQEPANSAPTVTRVISDSAGQRLQVNGEDFMVFGMNWGYMPIGENYNYSLWEQPDEVIVEALDREMPLLQAMGVNSIRQYVGIPPRWVQYIYQRYGIYTILNHTVGRYGYTLDGVWIPSIDYSNERIREALTDEIVALVVQAREQT